MDVHVNVDVRVRLRVRDHPETIARLNEKLTLSEAQELVHEGLDEEVSQQVPTF